ncbi:glutathione S-transferase [Fusarium oxysporum NRRL 32931]|uniref:Glutathione S-transferase n=1 Tax=Fusarium oxysporum NRRL 32931 TaxID=660029 RepID=W9IBR4_FUSOX|nr:glutathione S-transferase [Fusarium oxysporum NRRL 32931]
MSSNQLKPLTLWSHMIGPNPWKVAMVLEELCIPYKTELIDFPEMKQPPYEKININGRVPALEDPNTGIVLWESGAILEYLVETYDKTRAMSFLYGTAEYFYAKQWLHFQMSGQGPYFGQAMYFHRFHPEQIQSAKDRYLNEVRRVCGVLNRALDGREYLVGGRYSYADVAFLPWFNVVFFPWHNVNVPGVFADQIPLEKEFPHLAAWLNRLRQRPPVAKTLKDRFNALEKQ